MREKTDTAIIMGKLQTVAGEKARNATMMCLSYAYYYHQLLDYLDPFIENYLSICDPKTTLYMSTQRLLQYLNPYQKKMDWTHFRVSVEEIIK